MLVVRIGLIAALWVVGGCSATGGGSSSGPPPSNDRESLQPASVQPSRVPPSGSVGSPGPMDLPASIIDPVVAEVARLANVPVDQVTVKSAEGMTFPNGGLGCPEPGMAYTQVMVDGFKIVADAAGTTYDFRGTGPGRFRRCMFAGG
jgi:hypothetical protein